MLVLSRKIGEQLFIGSDITITVLESMGGKVRLGIEAPRETRVFRDKAFAEKHREEVKCRDAGIGVPASLNLSNL